METTDPSQETYRLWRIFTDPATGARAVAMSTTHSNIFISVYTILIGLAVATTWRIMISFTILLLTPRKMTRTMYIAVTTTWSQSEPWTAWVVLGEHSWRVFVGVLRKTHPAELTWKAFWFDLALLTVALGTGGGGFALGPVFSRSFTLGGIAPVNPTIVYLPPYQSYQDPVQQQRDAAQYNIIGALKAFGNANSAEAFGNVNNTETKSKGPIEVTSQPLESVDKEERYSIQYNYKLSGIDMGLQKFRDLTLEVSGNCSFQNEWWSKNASLPERENDNSTMTFYDIYIQWSPETLKEYRDVEQTSKL